MTRNTRLLALLLIIITSASCSGEPEPEVQQTTADADQEHRATNNLQAVVKAIEPFIVDIDSASMEQGAENQPQIIGESAAPTLPVAVEREIREVGEQFGRDAKSLLSYVSSEFGYEPYTGVLRGSAGTYLARSGNSADLALMLSELLRAGSPLLEMRFAACDSYDAKALLRNRSTAPITVGGIKSQATDAQSLAGVRWYQEALSRAKLEAAQVNSQLVSLLQTPLESILAKRANVTSLEIGHTWLQVKNGATWVDLDPTTRSGTPPCSLTATFDEIASNQYHSFTLSVIVESLKHDSLTEETSLRIEGTTAELAASRVLFTFGEPNGLVQAGPVTDDGLATYTPVLRIDDRSFTGIPLVLPRLKTSEGPQDVAGGFADVLGSDFYGGSAQLATPGDDVMSAWLQVDLESPDGTRVSARSEIFDRLGMAIRLKGSDSGFDLLPLAEVDGEYVATSSFWQVGLLLGELKSSWTTLDTSIELSTVDGLSAILDSVLRAFPAVRRDIGGEPASPMILMLGVVPSMREGDNLTMKVVLDALYVNSETTRDVESVSREAVATPMAEYLLVSSVGVIPDDLGDIVHVMRSARESSIPLITLRKGDSQRVEDASAVALARIGNRIESGQVLFTPARAATLPSGITQTAWWYMDPASAVLRDEHENGRHMAATEYTAKEKMKKPGMMSSIKRIGCAIAVPFFIAISATNYASPSKDTANVVKAFRSGGNEAEKRRKMREALRVACSREKSIRNVPPGPLP